MIALLFTPAAYRRSFHAVRFATSFSYYFSLSCFDILLSYIILRYFVVFAAFARVVAACTLPPFYAIISPLSRRLFFLMPAADYIVRYC